MRLTKRDPTGFAWNVGSGYQTDNDDGLTLLGHRYYDKRTRRFLTQGATEGKPGYGTFKKLEDDRFNKK